MSSIQQHERRAAERIRDEQRIREAAPAMLAALIWVRDAINSGKPFEMTFVNAAIKKAQG